MEHHSSGTVDNDPNGTFSSTILPVSTDATETNGLVVVGQFFGESAALVDPIVSVVGIHRHSNISGMLLELDLGINGVGGIEGYLVDHIDVIGGGIDKESCATELVVIGLASSSVELAPRDRREGLVTEDEVARSSVAFLE